MYDIIEELMELLQDLEEHFEYNQTEYGHQIGKLIDKIQAL